MTFPCLTRSFPFCLLPSLLRVWAQFRPVSLSRSLCLSLSCLYSLLTLPIIFCADGLRHIRIKRQSLLSSRYRTLLSSSRNNSWVLFLIMSVYTYWVYLIAGINCIYSFCDWTINLKSDPCEWPPHMILPMYVRYIKFISVEIALLWIGMYTVNIGLNILVAVRYYFEDRFPILIWLAYTIPVFIIRMTCMTYRKLRHSTTIYVCTVNGKFGVYPIVT